MDPKAIGAKIKQLYPQYQSVPDEQLGAKYMQKYGGAVSGVSSGQINIKDIPEAQRVGVSLGLEAVGYKPPEKAAEAKKTDQSNEILNFINDLEKQYRESGGGTFGVGPGARIKGAIENIKGKAGLNESAAVYEDARKGFAATLKSLTGDTGVLTDPDFDRLSNLLPKLGSTKKESVDKFNQLRSQLAAKMGKEKQETTFSPKVENERDAVASLADILFPGAVNLGEKAKSDFNRQLATGNYKTIVDLLFPKTSQDVGLIQDVMPAGVEAGNVLSLASGAASGIKKAVGGVVGGKAKVSTAREAAAQASEKVIDLNKLVEAGNKHVMRDPTAQKLWETTVKPALESQKQVSVPELLKQIQVWNDAYTSAGKVGKTALAGLNDALAKAGKEIIKKEAPEVAKYTKQLADMYAIDNLIKSFGPALIGGAGATAGGLIIGSSLGKAMGQK